MLKNRFVPDQRLLSLQDLDIEELKSMNKQGIIFDLDNTLGEQGVDEVNQEILKLFKTLLKSGFKIGILSNDRGDHREKLKEKLSHLPIIFDAKKPRRRGYRKILTQMGLTPQQAVMVGDQVFTDIYGANRLDIYSILVPPINSSTDPFFTKLKRLFKNLLFYLLRLRAKPG